MQICTGWRGLHHYPRCILTELRQTGRFEDPAQAAFVAEGAQPNAGH
jgi:hypothetical protein